MYVVPVRKPKPKRTTKQEFAHWNAVLKSEGMGEEPKEIPYWHTVPPDRATALLSGRSSRVAVRLPSDSNTFPGPADRVLVAASNRECADVYHDKISDWVWRDCNWKERNPSDRRERLFPLIEQRVMEAHVIHGESTAALAVRFEMDTRDVGRILERHRKLAGLPNMWRGLRG